MHLCNEQAEVNLGEANQLRIPGRIPHVSTIANTHHNYATFVISKRRYLVG